MAGSRAGAHILGRVRSGEARDAAGAPPPVVAPPPGHRRFPLFDSLRAIAALCVLTTHLSFVTGASYHSAAGPLLAQLTVGVPIFFLISGFLLYRPFFAARHHGRQRPRVLDFARRRVLRILPAYWIALTLVALGPGLSGVLTGDWWAYYGFAQVYRQATVLGGMTQVWSLCVEVTFYAALPFYALALERLSRGRDREGTLRVEVAGLALLFLAGTGFRLYAHEAGHGLWLLTLPGSFDWFALGMGLAVASVALRDRARAPRAVAFVERRPGACWLAAIAVFVLLSTQLDLPRGLEADYTALQRFLQHLLFGVVALLLLLPAVFGDGAGGLPRRILALPALAWLGAISYGVFLYNPSVVEWLQGHGVDGWAPAGKFAWLGLATLAVTVLCAAVSYYVVERPILRLKHRPRGPTLPVPSAPPRPRSSVG